MWRRILERMLAVVFAWNLLVMVYGLVRHPAAPIRQVGSGYADKMGRPRTADEHQDFRAWLTVFVASWVVLGVTMGATYLVSRRPPERRGRDDGGP